MSTDHATSSGATFRRSQDAVTSGDVEVISTMLDEVVDADVLIGAPMSVETPAERALKQAWATLLRAYRDVHVTVGDAIADEDELLASAWLSLEPIDKAQHTDASAEQTGLALGAAAAHRARAAVLLASGEPADAAKHALTAAAAAAEVGARIEAANSRTLAGRALAAAGSSAAAAAQLERAIVELDDCGAVRYRDAADQELRRLDRRFRSRKRSHEPANDSIAALTAREREIAELVTEGKRNREIAAELFLSQKTVETHLSNIFQKMCVNSRASLVREVVARTTTNTKA